MPGPARRRTYDRRSSDCHRSSVACSGGERQRLLALDAARRRLEVQRLGEEADVQVQIVPRRLLHERRDAQQRMLVAVRQVVAKPGDVEPERVQPHLPVEHGETPARPPVSDSSS